MSRKWQMEAEDWHAEERRKKLTKSLYLLLVVEIFFGAIYYFSHF